ncbi:hypothetical protein CTA1_2772 [Colletotrichum tanaceti]|uniref:Uncharacterized protein n=1 Tax=Colletotrichum tanaceti TaxID=1306861 RepID=A0A4U6XBL7_9PEZI|nr:hypothetical protein CTA1_2772 [Colletotrichum tanaceti]
MSRPMLGSRKRINAEQYKIENVRTTNLCLAGLDILRAVPNVLVIATSSMDTMTDDGHLDRCSIKANLSLLKVPERYEVPRRQFQSYPDASSIHCASVLPIHRDTVLHDLMAGETKDDSPGSHFSIWRGSLETGVFGRFVVNVVTHAQMGHIRHSTCDFFTAVGAVLRCIKQHFRKRSRDDADERQS